MHAVLERLFDLPAAGRTPAAAQDLLIPEWTRLCADDELLAALITDEAERTRFVADAASALRGYFKLEDPRRLEPAEREWYVETSLPSGLKLRGYIDRVDATPAGDLRIVDYKTGRVPLEAYEASALFQMKFYALVIWRLRGVIPKLLQLMYLSGDGEVLRYSPDEADLLATERKLNALWAAISRARETGDFRPRPSKLCDWCRHKALCPAFGGTLPPMPVRGAAGQPADVADAPVAVTIVAAPAAASAGVTTEALAASCCYLLVGPRAEKALEDGVRLGRFSSAMNKGSKMMRFAGGIVAVICVEDSGSGRRRAET